MNAVTATGSKRPGIAAHYLRYSAGSLLAIVAGLVSFPILTRLLDNTQYGILGYVDTWVVMAVSVGKLGAQHALLRLYPHGGDDKQMLAFSTNLFYLPLAVSLALWLVVASVLIVLNRVAGLHHSPIFWLALFLVPMLVSASMIEMVLRAMENSRLVMFTRVAWRWLELALVLACVVLVQHSALAAYGGKFIAAVLVIGFFYIRWTRANLSFDRASIDFSVSRQGMAYGLPLVANEIAMVALVSVDRLMLKELLGDYASVGVYTIGASLGMQVSVLLGTTLLEAFAPTANRLYDTSGAQAVRDLKASVLLVLTYASVAVAVLCACLGTDAIVALSGSDKAASGPVFAVMGVIYAVQPLLLICGYGLLLERRSMTVLALMCGALLLNVVGNLLWIPAYGVMGAVYATALSSAALAISHCVFVPRALLQLPRLRTVLIALAAASVVVLVNYGSERLGITVGWHRLLIVGPTMAALYAVVVLGLDRDLRTLIVQWRERVGRSSSRTS